MPVGAAAEQIRREADATFERLEIEAVEEYLDWYYSLIAEGGRLFALVTGGMEQMEDHLAEKVRETLEQEKWYVGINTGFERLTSADEEARTAYAHTVRDILDRNRIGPPRLQSASVDVTSISSLEDILQPSFDQDVIPAALRFLLAGGSSVVVARSVRFIIAQKVEAKMLAKRALKLVAKTPLKALASKALGRAATGAGLGTVLPGAGTAAGAIGGTIFSILIDGALLKVEEAMSRDDFRREIITAIREARREFEDQYLVTPNAPKPANP